MKTETREAFVHAAATVIGDVQMGQGCSIWPSAVLRADMNSIKLGEYVNIQDNTTIHTDSRSSVEIGDYSLIGHNVMLHGCKIGRGAMVGIGSIVLDGAEIGDGAMVTAGCMIRGGKKIPARALVTQKNGEIKIFSGKAKVAYTIAGSLEYVALAARHQAGLFKPFTEAEEREFLDQAQEIITKLGI